MKCKKIVSVVLALSMTAAFAGCSKVKSISGEDFVNACDKIGAVEVDPEDTGDYDDSDYEDGMYMIMDSDYIEENLSSDSLSGDLGMYGSMLPDVNSVIETEDIEEMTLFVKMNQNADDIESEDDLDDLEVDAVVAVQITLNDSEMVQDVMDNLADNLDDMLDINVENLGSDEYYSGKNEGYLKVNVDVQDVVNAFFESDLYDIISSYSDETDDLEDTLGVLTGNVSTAFYISGENVVIIIGGNINSDNANIDEFCSELGVQNPSDLSSNPDVAQAVVDYLDNTFGSMLSSLAAMSSYDY